MQLKIRFALDHRGGDIQVEKHPYRQVERAGHRVSDDAVTQTAWFEEGYWQERFYDDQRREHHAVYDRNGENTPHKIMAQCEHQGGVDDVDFLFPMLPER